MSLDKFADGSVLVKDVECLEMEEKNGDATR